MTLKEFLIKSSLLSLGFKSVGWKRGQVGGSGPVLKHMCLNYFNLVLIVLCSFGDEKKITMYNIYTNELSHFAIN